MLYRIYEPQQMEHPTPKVSHATQAPVETKAQPPTDPIPLQDQATPGDSGAALTKAEQELERKIIAAIDANAVIVTGRDKNNSSAPVIAVDIETRGPGCSWVRKAADTLQRVGKVIATDDVALSLPRLQYFLFPNGREHSSVRIVRIPDLVEALKSGEAPVKLLAHGRIIAGDDAVDGCLPGMKAKIGKRCTGRRILVQK